jgi:hypothetical protein
MSNDSSVGGASAERICLSLYLSATLALTAHSRTCAPAHAVHARSRFAEAALQSIDVSTRLRPLLLAICARVHARTSVT